MHSKTLITLSSAFAFSCVLAACGGGGGGGPMPPNNTPTPTPTVTPTSPPTPSGAGQMMVAGTALANARIVFTCGCSGQAGSTTADGNGNYTVPQTSNAVPQNPTPTYTAVPGRNYMVIGAGASSHAEAWTMLFLGSVPSHNLYLSTSNVTDQYTTAASLYIFYNSQNASDQSFDLWNFNTIASWTASLRTSGGNNAAEKKLIGDVLTFQQSATTLFPTVPAWDPDGPSANATIASDVQAVNSSVDSLKPTPCPNSGCTGAPTP
jgi:hypothetical protein